MWSLIRILVVGCLVAGWLRPAEGQIWPRGCTGWGCITGLKPQTDLTQQQINAEQNQNLEAAMALTALKDVGGGSSDEETDPLSAASGTLSDLKPELLAALHAHGTSGGGLGTAFGDLSTGSALFHTLMAAQQQQSTTGFGLAGLIKSLGGNISAGPSTTLDRKALLMRVLQNVARQRDLNTGLGGPTGVVKNAQNSLPSRQIWPLGNGVVLPQTGSRGVGGFLRKPGVTGSVLNVPLVGVVGRPMNVPITGRPGGKTRVPGSCQCRRQCQWPERNMDLTFKCND